MHLIADIEAKLHAILHGLGLDHGIPEPIVTAAKAEVSAVLVNLKPVVDLGIQSAAAIVSTAAAERIGGPLGTAVGQIAAAAITSEALGLEASAEKVIAP